MERNETDHLVVDRCAELVPFVAQRASDHQIGLAWTGQYLGASDQCP
jgi:hypothetical protein